MDNIIELYRFCDTQKQFLSKIVEELKLKLSCQSVSIFLFVESIDSLILSASTSIPEISEDLYFGRKFPIYNMLVDKKDEIISERKMLSEYPKNDMEFENIQKLTGILYARIFGLGNERVGVVRALNKIGKGDKTNLFSEGDLIIASQFCNIIGVTLSAFMSDKKMITFLDSVTHELLAPISGVKNVSKFLLGYLNRIKNENIDMERIKDNLYDMVGFSELSISLIQNLTMFSRSGEIKSNDLSLTYTKLHRDIISKCVRNLNALICSRMFNKNNIKTIDHWRIPTLSVDKKLMLQVFTNLLHNAIRYSHDNPQQFSVVIHHKINKNGNLEIYIDDNGIGIEKDFSDKIFHPGKRAPSAINKLPTGTGIGLTTVKKLLQTHEMSIKLINNISPTSFVIQIPRKFIYKEQN